MCSYEPIPLPIDTPLQPGKIDKSCPALEMFWQEEWQIGKRYLTYRLRV